MSTDSSVPSSQVRFPDLDVEYPAEHWNRPGAGKALRAQTRLVLDRAGHASESLEYLEATKDLQDAAMRDALLRVTREWVNVEFLDPPTGTTRPGPDSPPPAGPSAPADVTSSPGVEVQNGWDAWRVLAFVGIWLVGVVGGCTALLKDVESAVYEDVDHELGPPWSFALAPLFVIAGSMLVAAIPSADRGREGIDRVHKAYVLVLVVLTGIGLVAMGTAVGN